MSKKYPLIIEGAVFLASFFYFPFVALYDEINSVSFLFPAVAALYGHIIRVSPAPSLYSIFQICQLGNIPKLPLFFLLLYVSRLWAAFLG